jgi:hypothetical protein
MSLERHLKRRVPPYLSIASPSQMHIGYSELNSPDVACSLWSTHSTPVLGTSSFRSWKEMQEFFPRFEMFTVTLYDEFFSEGQLLEDWTAVQCLSLSTSSGVHTITSAHSTMLSWSAYSWTLKMDALRFPEKSLNLYQATLCHIPKGSSYRTQLRENFKSFLIFLIMYISN